MMISDEEHIANLKGLIRCIECKDKIDESDEALLEIYCKELSKYDD